MTTEKNKPVRAAVPKTALPKLLGEIDAPSVLATATPTNRVPGVPLGLTGAEKNPSNWTFEMLEDGGCEAKNCVTARVIRGDSPKEVARMIREG
jgi:hypothetical protein